VRVVLQHSVRTPDDMWAPSTRAAALPLLLVLAAAAGHVARAQPAAGVDWSAVRTDISTLLRADLRLATAALRLGFHACGTFDAGASTGGCQCAAALNVSSTANLGLAVVAPQLRAVQAAHAGASIADVFTLAAVVAVSEMRGPTIPWRAGRVDAPCAPPPNAEALLPDAMSDGFATPATPTPDGAPPSAANTFAPAAVRAVFARMGLSDGATVALMGAHTVGHCHNDRSGFFGAWTTQPFLFTNGARVHTRPAPLGGRRVC
jgi:cytochrome c peroxidase